LSNDFYVDDLLTGTPTLEEAIHLQKELTSLLNTAGFTLRKWASNHPSFMDSIPIDLKETNQTLSLANDNGVTTLVSHKEINRKFVTTLPRYHLQMTQEVQKGRCWL